METKHCFSLINTKSASLLGGGDSLCTTGLPGPSPQTLLCAAQDGGNLKKQRLKCCAQGVCPPESCELCRDPQIKDSSESACVPGCVRIRKRERAKIEAGWGHPRISFHSPICTQLSFKSPPCIWVCNSQRMTRLLYSPPDPTVSSKLEQILSAGILGPGPSQQPSSIPVPVFPPTEPGSHSLHL